MRTCAVLFLLLLLFTTVFHALSVERTRYPVPIREPMDWQRVASANRSIDSSFRLQGFFPLQFSNAFFGPVPLPVALSTFETIELPQRSDGDTLFARISFRTQQLDTVYVLFRHFDEREMELRADTVWLPANVDSIGVDHTIIDPDIRCLQVRVDVIPTLKNRRGQGLWMSPLVMSMTSTPVFALRDEVRYKVMGAMQGATADYTAIYPLNKARILSLGELIHGSEEVNSRAFDLIKYRVKECGCRLIICELLAEDFLQINRYMQGDPGFEDVRKSDVFNQALLSNRFWELIDWLRDHNLAAAPNDRV